MFRILAVLLGTVVLLGALVLFSLRLYDAPGPLQDSRAVVVPRTGLAQISDLLAKEGVVANPLTLRLAGLATRGQGPMHSSELSFPAHASLRTVLQVLRFGKPVQHRLTIAEGLTAAQVAVLVSAAPAAEGDVAVPAEGSVLPETYSYERGTARAALLERARKAMDHALEQAWAARSPASAPLATPHDALVLASIVERETSRADERPRIAMVFLNRLRRGMKLQSDPTVVYGASGGLGVLDHGLTRAELEHDDPYNTYRIPGLPAGPISMPGLASLKAVTQPWPSEELYFVADGTGGHLFAKTEADHNRNVARWREFERQRAAQPAPTAGTSPPKPSQN
jgi:UPF0755 protein